MIALPPGYELREGADAAAAHRYLTTSYWAAGITADEVKRSFENAFLVSIWKDGAQVGMARVLTDHVTFAYLHDVYVLDGHGGRGLAKAMLGYIHAHPRLQNIRRWALFTKDAQSLYAGFGWKQYPWPERMMIIDPRVFTA